MLPFGLIEQALRLVNNLLESTDPTQRKAALLTQWHVWWPFTKMFLNDAQEKQIEDIMKQVGQP